MQQTQHAPLRVRYPGLTRLLTRALLLPMALILVTVLVAKNTTTDTSVGSALTSEAVTLPIDPDERKSPIGMLWGALVAALSAFQASYTAPGVTSDNPRTQRMETWIDFLDAEQVPASAERILQLVFLTDHTKFEFSPVVEVPNPGDLRARYEREIPGFAQWLGGAAKIPDDAFYKQPFVEPILLALSKDVAGSAKAKSLLSALGKTVSHPILSGVRDDTVRSHQSRARKGVGKSRFLVGHFAGIKAPADAPKVVLKGEAHLRRRLVFLESTDPQLAVRQPADHDVDVNWQELLPMVPARAKNTATEQIVLRVVLGSYYS